MKSQQPNHRSNNKYDVYKWVERVINSCKTISQLMAADRLNHLFLEMYNDMYLYQELSNLSSWRWDELDDIEVEQQMITS